VKRVRWRWEERDFGFRFKSGRGKRTAEHYQGNKPNTFYIVPANQRKLESDRLKELDCKSTVPDAFDIIPNPWRNYEREWDWIETEEGLCFNYAGCLDREEIDRREDEGVGRAMEYVVALLDKPEPVALTLAVIRRIHSELMGAIYPFAGEWRKVSLHKGEGPTKWPIPPGGIEPVMSVFEREVLSRSPFLSEKNEDVFGYASEVMNEVLAIHPFREGNGRAAFIMGNLILMQNRLLPLDHYERKNDEDRYFDACEAGRIHAHYRPLADLIAEWEANSIERWESEHGR
jgi:cell filamentation protein